MVKPKIAVIIPVLNTAEYLDECILSVLDQGIEDIEIHCFENGSTDDSPLILAKWAKRDDRIKVYTIANEEWSDVQSIDWIKPIECEYIYRVDSDDYLESGFLAKLLPILEDEQLDMLFFEGESIFETDDLPEAQISFFRSAYKYSQDYAETTSGSYLFSRLAANDDFFCSMCMYVCRKSFLDEWDPPVFQTRLKSEGDNYVTIMRLLVANRVQVFRESGYRRRVRSNSVMTTRATVENTVSIITVSYEIIKHIAVLNLDSEALLAIAAIIGPRIGNSSAYLTRVIKESSTIESLIADFTDSEQKLFTLALVASLREKDKYIEQYELWQDEAQTSNKQLINTIDRLSVMIDEKNALLDKYIVWQDEARVIIETKNEKIDQFAALIAEQKALLANL